MAGRWVGVTLAAAAVGCAGDSRSAPEIVERSQAARPTWVASPAPLIGSCSFDDVEMVCTGASSLAPNLDQARAMARDAAVEEMVLELATRIENQPMRIALLGYPGVRMHTTDEQDRRAGQAAVARSLRAQHDLVFGEDEYWERYAAEPDGPSRYLGLVRLRLPIADFGRLQTAYTTRHPVLGAEVVDFFPGVAWRYRDVVTGATFVSMGEGDLHHFGLAAGYVVVSIEDERVASGAAFAARAKDVFEETKREGGAIKIDVRTGDTPVLRYHKPIPKRTWRDGDGLRNFPGGDYPPHPTPPGWNDGPPTRGRRRQ